MINSKLEKIIKLGFGIVIFILGIISFIILPNKVGMQISVSGKLQNYMPNHPRVYNCCYYTNWAIWTWFFTQWKW